MYLLTVVAFAPPVRAMKLLRKPYIPIQLCKIDPVGEDVLIFTQLLFTIESKY
jgi:hypothetical protein